MAEGQDVAERGALLDKLRATPVPARVMPFPRCDLGGMPIAQCRVEVLRHAAIDEARARVASRLVSAGTTPETVGSVAWEVLFGDAMARDLLCQAIRGQYPIPGTGEAGGGTEVYPQLFATAEELSELLTPSEIELLLAEYNVVQDHLAASQGEESASDDVED